MQTVGGQNDGGWETRVTGFRGYIDSLHATFVIIYIFDFKIHVRHCSRRGASNLHR